MKINWLIVISTAVIPLLTGIAWYHPRVFGSVWMKEAGISDAETHQVNMVKTILLVIMLSVLVAFFLFYAVVHQAHIFSSVINEPDLKNPDSELSKMISRFMDLYGRNFRTFKHGLLHGAIAGVTLALPVVAVNAMFERRSWKYILIHAGYWILSFALMGGFICAFA